MPVGGRFGLANTALPVCIQLETGDGLDDIRLDQDDSSRIELQSKTSAGLTTDPNSPLGKTLRQLVRIVMDARGTGIAVDPMKTRAILAVAANAPRSLDALERGCRAFDLGGSWATTKAGRSSAERDALDIFETHARSAWVTHSVTSPTDDELVMMARLFRIERFSMNEGEVNWREASRLLGARLYGAEASGDAPLRELKDIIRGMIGSCQRRRDFRPVWRSKSRPVAGRMRRHEKGPDRAPFHAGGEKIFGAYVGAISPVSGSTISSAGLSWAPAMVGLRRRVDWIRR
jgi:hypothetical protein